MLLRVLCGRKKERGEKKKIWGLRRGELILLFRGFSSRFSRFPLFKLVGFAVLARGFCGFHGPKILEVL